MRQAFGEVRNEARDAIRATPNDSHLASAQHNSLPTLTFPQKIVKISTLAIGVLTII
jgi:hypothetical protein